MRYLLRVAGLILILALSACVYHLPTQPAPDSVGSYWTYEIVRTGHIAHPDLDTTFLETTVDTVIIEIAGDTVLSATGETALIWRCVPMRYGWPALYTVRDYSITKPPGNMKIYWHVDDSIPLCEAPFPLEAERAIAGLFDFWSPDTGLVMDTATIHTPAGDMLSIAWHDQRAMLGDEASKMYRYWYTGAGWMIRMNIRGFFGGSPIGWTETLEIWTLIDYRVGPEPE